MHQLAIFLKSGPEPLNRGTAHRRDMFWSIQYNPSWLQTYCLAPNSYIKPILYSDPTESRLVACDITAVMHRAQSGEASSLDAATCSFSNLHAKNLPCRENRFDHTYSNPCVLGICLLRVHARYLNSAYIGFCAYAKCAVSAPSSPVHAFRVRSTWSLLRCTGL